jgi:hypothetical protein
MEGEYAVLGDEAAEISFGPVDQRISVKDGIDFT